MKQLITFCVILTTFHSSYSQFYTFSHDTAPYQEFNDGAVITTTFDVGLMNIEFQNNLNAPFQLSAFDKGCRVDSITIGSGFIGTETADSKYFVFIDPIFVQEIRKYDASSSVTHKVETVGGIKYYKIQWKNVELSEAPGFYINFQLWIEETSHNVTYHYGPTNIPETATTAKGIQTGVFLIDQATNSLKEYWVLTGNPSNPSPTNTQFDVMYSFPKENTRYKFNNKNYTGISDLNDYNDLVKVYPNPAREHVNFSIDIPQSEMLNIDLLDVTGRVVKSIQDKGKDSFSFSLEGLQSGMYFYRITTAKEGEFAGKLMIR